MKIPHANFRELTMFLIILFSLYSCSKDSDLLADYVVVNAQESLVVRNIFVDDHYIINGNETIILDVLSNDTIVNPDGVRITQISQPAGGEVAILEERSISYLPKDSSNIQEETTDSFSYTTETTQNDGSTTTEETSVLVTKINDEVKYWQRLFDDKWDETDYEDALARSKSANRNQEYYFLSYYIDGLSSMWQATGDNLYLDRALSLIKNTMDDAVSVGNGYKGWPSSKNQEHGLWDSFYWRHVVTLIRIMYQSPNLRASGYQSQYEEILDFSEKNIWNRYESYGPGSFYRSRTHMASHWARIGMELHIITGKAKYKEVFDNISHGKMSGYPSNLRNQFYANPKNSSAACWDMTWGVPTGSDVQDTDHAGPVISFLVTSYENGYYWTKEDMNALGKTLDIVWTASNPEAIRYYLDGTGGVENPGRAHEWLNLGRYDRDLQDRIKKSYNGKHLNFFGAQPLGIGALNAKILHDGSAVYPENQ